MNEILHRGQTVYTAFLETPCLVDHFIGAGTQGEVYRVSLADKPSALKWYFGWQATPEQRAALETLISKGSPNDRFLWPRQLVTAPNVPGFGYLMPLREDRYKKCVDLMTRRKDPSFRALATAGFHLAHSFLQLHAKGLCYRDISFGNIFIDPDTGDILICDNDNVTVDGTAISALLGTPRFMAPEIVRGEALPGTQTDLHSLAVLLFYLLFVHHPLEGKKELAIRCFDLPAMTKIHGTEPVFIFDPDDDTNRPVPGRQDNPIAFWCIYPQFLRDQFTRAFTAGLRDPQNGRVRESEWRAAMVHLRDSILYCGRCGMENFYDADMLQRSGGAPGSCWSCRRQLQLPFRIRVGRNTVMLNHDTKLFPHHIDDNQLYDFSKPIAMVSRHPTNPSVWGLMNLSISKWVIRAANGQVTDVEPGQAMGLAAGNRVGFGNTEGEIAL